MAYFSICPEIHSVKKERKRKKKNSIKKKNNIYINTMNNKQELTMN